MAKLNRELQKIFALNAGPDKIAIFGSLAAGAPTFSTDVSTIQSLSNYLGGWFSGVVGANSPAIEDMNALFYVITSQLAYLFQAGVPEWNSETSYYIGSLATNSSGEIFVSLTDDNLGNALTNATNWRSLVGSNVVAINPATQSPYTLTAADNGRTFLVNTANGAMTFILPTANIKNFRITVKDSAGSAGTNNITIDRSGAVQFEGLAADYLLQAAWGMWTMTSDGTNWFLV